MAVRGHTLVWYREVPDVGDRPAAGRAPSSRSVLRDHIQQVVGHYRGRVAQWDVVNEAVDARTGSCATTCGCGRSARRYIDLAFQLGPRGRPGREALLQRLRPRARRHEGARGRAAGARAASTRGVPIDGVGIQGHETLSATAGRAARSRRRCSATRGLGLDVGLTELDVGINLPADEHEAGRARRASTATRSDACLDVPRCRTFVTWGFTRRATRGCRTSCPGYGDALPFDAQYRGKPALDALRAELAGHRS